VIFDALAGNDIDVYIDYSGTLWANQFHQSGIKPREQLLDELKATLAKQNITLLGELGFENAYALVMPRKRAEQLGIRTIADLASRAPTMSIAADYEFFSRPEWTALKKALRAAFRTQSADAAGFHVRRGRFRRGRRDRRLYQRRLIAKYDLVCWTTSNTRSRLMTRWCCWRRSARTIALRSALQPPLARRYRRHASGQPRAAGNDATSSPDAVASWLWERSGRDNRRSYNPLIMPASIRRRLKRRASAPFLQS
jgi:osmoprotectant transport system permease protein